MRSIPTLMSCAAVLVAVAACTPTGSQEPASPGASTSSPAAETDPTQPTPSESTAEDEPTEASSGSEAETDPADTGGQPEQSSVTVLLGGSSTVVEPTAVYCSGAPGDIEHIIGKTNDQLPLIEVSGSQFAMVKIEQRGAPERTQNPQGISYGQDWVTFTDATVGDATLDGSMVCTDWED